MLMCRTVVVVPRGAAVHSRTPPSRVDEAPAHPRQVDHDTALGDSLAGDVVPAPSNRDLQTLGSGETHRVGDIGGVDASGDERRPLVDEAIVDGPRLAVTAIIRPDDLTGELRTERIDSLARQHQTHRSSSAFARPPSAR